MRSFERRGGLVAPWTAVPALVVLATDPSGETRDLALRLLRQQADKQPDFLLARVTEGLLAVPAFQQRLWAASRPGVQQPMGASAAPNLTLFGGTPTWIQYNSVPQSHPHGQTVGQVCCQDPR